MLVMLGLGGVLVVIAAIIATKMVQHHRLFHKLYKFFDGKDVMRIIDQVKKVKSKIGYFGEKGKEVEKKENAMTREEQKVTMIQLKELHEDERVQIKIKEEGKSDQLISPAPSKLSASS